MFKFLLIDEICQVPFDWLPSPFLVLTCPSQTVVRIRGEGNMYDTLSSLEEESNEDEANI